MTSEMQHKKEFKEIPNPEEVYIAASISHPKWYPVEIKWNDEKSLFDKIRGDLILAHTRQYLELGFSVSLVYLQEDNSELINEIEKMNTTSDAKNSIHLRKQQTKGYANGRREAIRLSIENKNCKVIYFPEIEKPVTEYVEDMVLPIFNGEADMTLLDRQITTDVETEQQLLEISDKPQRPNENLRGMPNMQARSENVFMVWFNKFMKQQKIIPEDSPFIDLWSIRAWKNTDKITSFFLANYKVDNANASSLIDPERESAAVLFPVIWMLYLNSEKPGSYKIVSVPVDDYHHPDIVAKAENNFANFPERWKDKRIRIKREIFSFVQWLKGGESFINIVD